MNLKQLYLQALKFVGVSGIGWCMDFALYTTLAWCGVPLFTANLLGSTLGVTFVFISSTRFIFKNQGPIPLYAKYLFYLLYQAVLLFFMSKLLVTVHGLLGVYAPAFVPASILPLLAKMMITPVSMVINFIVLKNMIEKL